MMVLRIEAEVASLHCILSTVGSATASETTEKPPFRSQEDLCASKTSDDVFSSEGTNVSPGPSSATQSNETQTPIKTGSPNPTSTASSFPYLKVSGLTSLHGTV